MAYSDKVIEHYENPRNVGSLDAQSDDVGTGLVGTSIGLALRRSIVSTRVRPSSSSTRKQLTIPKRTTRCTGMCDRLRGCAASRRAPPSASRVGAARYSLPATASEASTRRRVALRSPARDGRKPGPPSVGSRDKQRPPLQIGSVCAEWRNRG